MFSNTTYQLNFKTFNFEDPRVHLLLQSPCRQRENTALEINCHELLNCYPFKNGIPVLKSLIRVKDLFFFDRWLKVIIYFQQWVLASIPKEKFPCEYTVWVDF